MNFDYTLLAKYVTGILIPEEREEVMKWRSLSADNARIYTDLVRLRISERFHQYNTPNNIEQALRKANARIDRKRRRMFIYSTLRYVAFVLACFSLSYGGYSLWKPENHIRIVVKTGEEVKKMELPDGTVVWLRGGSCLKYPKNFSGERRMVTLQGEAFFDVAKRDIPFYIGTDFLNIQVTGTAFEVKTNEAGRRVETTLVNGQVNLLDLDRKKVMSMSPGEKVTYSQAGNQYATEKIDVNLCATWRLNQLVFENKPLREIANHLSTRFGVNINIESSQLAGRRFRYVFNKDESLPDVLNWLKYMTPISYQIEGREVFIRSNNPKDK